MSKFCIELEGVMLPDAIAAVVEAWYDVQNVESAADWVEDLRLQIKREFGRGWSVRGVGATKLNPDGRCQLTRIAPDRSRTSVILPLDFCGFLAEEIKSDIFMLIGLYNHYGGTLQDCLKKMEDLGAFDAVPANAF